MAGFGGEYARFAKFATEETSTAAPTYEAPVDLGPLVTGNLTVTNASGELYGDNVLQEKVDKFASGAIAMEVTDCPKKTLAEIYGATYNETNKEIEYGQDDEPPYGALSYIRNIYRKGKEIFEAIFYPKVQAALAADNTQTRAGSITFQNTAINWTVLAPLHKDTPWRGTAEFDTREDAVAWLDEKLGALEITITTQPQDVTVTEGEISETLSIVASAGSKTLSYQWYENSTESTVGGTPVSEATSATFTIPTTLTEIGGPYYYYCVVSCEGLESVTSEVVTVTVDDGEI